MISIFHYPYTGSLPHFEAPAFFEALKGREYHVYALGLRASNPTLKAALLQELRNDFVRHPVFASKTPVSQWPEIEIIFDTLKSEIELHVFPVILMGRYTKLARTIAQTFHYCPSCKGKGCSDCHGKGKITEESVQELITPFLQKAFACGKVLFHGAGREDVDVRMLGNGRPFALTLENPMKRSADMAKLQEEINSALKGKVQLSNLEIGKSFDVGRITQQYHTKRYRALVESQNNIDAPKLDAFLNKKMDILQTTPQRVEKRRAMKQRPHWVTLEKVVQVDTTHIEIELHASAGCYIKEFISGDEGRSVPSLAEWLGKPCSCQELDVLEIVDGNAMEFYVVE